MRALIRTVLVAWIFWISAAPQIVRTPDQPRVLNANLARDIEQADGSIDDPMILDYLNRLAAKVNGTSALKVRVTKSLELNATPLADQGLYLSAAILRLTESEDELAGLLAHLNAHAGPRAACAFATQALPNSNRGGEAEANATASANLRVAGYDPATMFTFLAKLVRKNRAWSRAFAPEDLIAGRNGASSPPRGTDYLINTSQFVRMRARLELLWKPWIPPRLLELPQ